MGPADVDEEDMKTLIEKYNVPDNPGLVNYLNLHHDILAVHKYVIKEREPLDESREISVDFTALFVSI